MKIDLVYTWLDGSDPIWLEKRDSYLTKVDICDNETFCEGRIVDNNELLYSLRSVELYAPWINHIFIITDRQRPQWLNSTNKNVTIIDHNDILPNDVLPTFNSVAIEQCLHKIDGLSEHFLYANDDMMFGRKVSPDLFFTKLGMPIYYIDYLLGFNNWKVTTTYLTTIICANRVINKDYGLDCLDWSACHNIVPYTKSNITNCLSRYSEWSRQTMQNRFRSKNDMQRHIFSLWAIANNLAVVVLEQPHPQRSLLISLLRSPLLLFTRLGIRKGPKGLAIPINNKHIYKIMKIKKPALVCFNDGEAIDDAQRLLFRENIARVYPKKSSFEI